MATVSFEDGSTTLGTGILTTVNGVVTATFTTSALTAGLHTITAVYGGDTNDQGSTAPVVALAIGATGQNVTQTVLAPSSVAAPLFGQAEVLTATVTVTQPGSDPAAVTPTGTVRFLNGSIALGTAPLTVSNGVTSADLITAALPVGAANSLTAMYTGDANDISSVSGPMSVSVTPVAITTTLSASTSAPVVGQSVVLNATVTEQGGGAGVLTGTGDVLRRVDGARDWHRRRRQRGRHSHSGHYGARARRSLAHGGL